MVKYIWHRAALAALVTATVLGACSGEPKKGPDSALGTDTTLNRDLSMAGRDTTAQPQLNDVPANAAGAANAPTTKRPATRTATTRPQTTTKTPPPPPPTKTTPSGNIVTTTPKGGTATGGGAVGTIDAGTTFNLTSNSRVCTNTNAVGDKITASLAEPVSGSNGAVIPAGATVTLTVTKLKRSENVNDPVVMEFNVNSVTYGGNTYVLDAAVQSATVDRIKDQPKSKDVQKVVGGAVVGAIAGQIIGKNTKSTVIGAAAGAAAGAGAAAATSNYQGCIPSGGKIVVKLNSAAQVRV